MNETHPTKNTHTYKITARVTSYKEDQAAEVSVRIDDRAPGSCLLLWEVQNDRWVWHGDSLDSWASDEVQSWILGLPEDDYRAGCDALLSACTNAIDRYEAGEDIELGDFVEKFHIECEEPEDDEDEDRSEQDDDDHTSQTIELSACVDHYTSGESAIVEVIVGSKRGTCQLTWEGNQWGWYGATPGWGMAGGDYCEWASGGIIIWLELLDEDNYTAGLDALFTVCLKAIAAVEGTAGDTAAHSFEIVSEPSRDEEMSAGQPDDLERLLVAIDERAERLSWVWGGSYKTEIGDVVVTATKTRTGQSILYVLGEDDQDQERTERVYLAARRCVAERALQVLAGDQAADLDHVPSDRPSCPRCKSTDIDIDESLSGHRCVCACGEWGPIRATADEAMSMWSGEVVTEQPEPSCPRCRSVYVSIALSRDGHWCECLDCGERGPIVNDAVDAADMWRGVAR